ncbi:MAG: hypothetical protein LQ351_002265 [Letrouitia transgressa]|nr:MAG: hypothetical protein LQ351_002265 [Letrouitia transgressa]
MLNKGSRREYHIVVLGAGVDHRLPFVMLELSTSSRWSREKLFDRCAVQVVSQTFNEKLLTPTAQFVQNVWIESYDPTIEDSYRKQIEVDSGQGFLLVFSITSLSSLTELHELRDQIVRIKDDPQVPLVIVGNKCDLEDDRVVSRARAFAVSQSWGNVHYYETSARRRANVDEAFVDLCRQIIRKDVATSTIRDMESGSRRKTERPRHHRHKRPSAHRRPRPRDGPICNIL